jgi:Tol biopolymer transport system component
MPLTAGTRIGAYEILAPLGAGGMGEVYRARDTRLGRDVAVKTLPEDVSANSERIARLQREAQLLAALNHPHIASIFGLETVNGSHFLVLELVDGESLADVISRGRMSFRESMKVAGQIVDALEAAHDKGIIHRDLKPGNVMLTHDGQVKVLDFGLARTVDGDVSSSVTNSPTLSFAATQAGVILGTAAYMSPEQAKGRAADKRSDVWAFGCIFFEMLTGERAFDGEDVSDILAGILRGEPDWNAFPADVPQATRTLIRRCLEKDRRARIPDMAVVRFFMTEVAAADSAANRPPKPDSRRLVVLTGMASALAGVALTAAAIYGWRGWNAPLTQPLMRFSLVPSPTQPIIATGADRTIAISPDGTYIAHAAGLPGQSFLVVRPIGQLEGTVLAGTEGARQPFFSPDSRHIAFFSGSELKKIAVAGGPPLTLCSIGAAPPRGGTWGDSDTILFATSSLADGLMSVSAAGGQPRSITKPAPAARDHILPAFLPGGRHALFTAVGAGNIFKIGAVDTSTGAVTELLAGGAHAEFVAPGYLVYGASGSLRSVRFDPEHLKVLSDPVPVMEGVRTASSGAAYFALTKTGTLLYVPGEVPEEERSLVWFNRRGEADPISAPPRSYANPRLSPDDGRVALDVRDGNQDIWIWSFARQTLERVTFDPATDQSPIWTKDGRRIVFASARGGVSNLYAQAADGTGTAERWTMSENVHVPMWISTDALSLLFIEVATTTGPDLMLLRRNGTDSRTAPLLRTSFAEGGSDVSPDGRWIAYQSNEGGRNQIYVRPFPNVDEGRWQISVGGGTRPVWGKDGKELFFLDAAQGLITVPVQTTPTFAAGQPTKLFDPTAFVGLPGRSYDVSRDSQRFLVVTSGASGDKSATPASLVVVLHWVEELRSRFPR